MIIDFHTHCYPDKLAEKAVGKVKGTPFEAVYNGTYEGLEEDNAKAGIDYAVVQCIANKPGYEHSVNEYALSLKDRKGLIPFGSVHPFTPEYKDIIDDLSRKGIKGLKFHPYYQSFETDDSRVIKVCEYAAQKGMIILFHGGLDLIMTGEYNTPVKMRRVIDALGYPKIVVAHMGGWDLYEDAFKYIVGCDCYIDTSFSYRFVSEDIRKRFIENHDPDKILFGTDRPWVDAGTDIQLIKRLPPDIAQKILYKNAKRLLEL